MEIKRLNSNNNNPCCALTLTDSGGLTALLLNCQSHFICFSGLSKDGQLVSEKEGATVSSCFAKVAGIKEVLARDHMKVSIH